MRSRERKTKTKEQKRKQKQKQKQEKEIKIRRILFKSTQPKDSRVSQFDIRVDMKINVSLFI